MREKEIENFAGKYNSPEADEEREAVVQQIYADKMSDPCNNHVQNKIAVCLNEAKELEVYMNSLYSHKIEEARKEGIKEVFEFLRDNSAGIMMNEYALEAKLKEWGLEQSGVEKEVKHE